MAQRVGRGIALLVHNHGTRRGGCSSVGLGRTLPPGKTRYPFYRRLVGSQGRSGRAENLVATGIRSQTVQPVVSRYTEWATRPTFWISTPSQLVHSYQRFDGLYCFHLQGLTIQDEYKHLVLKMKAIRLWLFTTRHAVHISEILVISAAPPWEPRISKSTTSTSCNRSEASEVYQNRSMHFKPPLGLLLIAGR